MRTLLSYSIFFLGLNLLTSCASRYRLIEPLGLDLGAQQFAQNDSLVKIAYRYDVLRAKGNRKDARQEKQNRVSMLAISIENDGPDTLLFPEDFRVLAGVQPPFMFTMEESIDLLRQRNNINMTVDEIEDLAFVILILPCAVVNAVIEHRANKRFSNELKEYYLWPAYIAPGHAVGGLLALDVELHTALEFVILNEVTRPKIALHKNK